MSKYSSDGDQANFEALRISEAQKTSFFGVTWADTPAILAVIGAVVVFVWIIKPPVTIWFKKNFNALRHGLMLFCALCVFPAFLWWSIGKPNDESWSKWTSSSLLEVGVGFLGIINLTAMYYVVNFVFEKTNSYVAGWISFFVMLTASYYGINFLFNG